MRSLRIYRVHYSDAHSSRSETGAGLHTTGIVGFAWNSFDMFAPPDKQASVYAKMQAAVDAVDESTNPGLKEAFRIATERFIPGKRGSPGSEFISFPGFLSGPSESLFFVVLLCLAES